MTLDPTHDQSALAFDQFWVGPFAEIDRYGDQTGHFYVRCQHCGIEVLEQDREHATHRSTCPNALDSAPADPF